MDLNSEHRALPNQPVSLPPEVELELQQKQEPELLFLPSGLLPLLCVGEAPIIKMLQKPLATEIPQKPPSQVKSDQGTNPASRPQVSNSCSNQF